MGSRRIPTDTEREGLVGYLDKQREELVALLDGLTEPEARSAPTASSLSLLALLRHLTLWERRWFRTVVAGEVFEGEWPYSEADWTVVDFELGPDDDIAGSLERYGVAADASRAVVAAMDLEDHCRLDRYTGRNVRSVLLHMIAEYARHCGHGDIIRETILANRPAG